MAVGEWKNYEDGICLDIDGLTIWVEGHSIAWELSERCFDAPISLDDREFRDGALHATELRLEAALAAVREARRGK